MNKRPEILAPCGNMDSLRAAIAAGADACYLAGNSFGARAYADNFSTDELIDAIGLAHLNNIKIYLTCNTLIKNNELGSVYDMLVPLYEAGLDAVLVQDFGVLRLVREYLPGLDIHTSTQMNILTPAGARLAKHLGAKRVVAAREMTLRELAAIKEEADIEVEAFVHGAMCLSYSGRCLMSSMAGDRSGNRGRCAQPCRHMYNGRYPLSMRDLCTVKLIPEIIEAGVDSLKIEGRMKNEYYTAATVEAYRILADKYIAGDFSLEEADRYERRLLDIFNRGGFTTGYFNRERTDKLWDESLIDDSMPGRRGVRAGLVGAVKDGGIDFTCEIDIAKGDELLIDTAEPIMITSSQGASKGDTIALRAPRTRDIHVGDAIYRTRSYVLTEEIGRLLSRDMRISVDGEIKISVGDPLSLTFSTEIGGRRYTVTEYGTICTAAETRPIDDKTVNQKISGLGNTAFRLRELNIINDNHSFVRIGDLSELRRRAADSLEDMIRREGSRKRPERILEIGSDKPRREQGDKTLYSFSYLYQLEEFIKLSEEGHIEESPDIYLIIDMGMGGYDSESIYQAIDIIRSSELNCKIIIGLPYINRGDENQVDYFEAADGILIRCIDDLAILRNKYSNKEILLAASLYVYNNMAEAEIMDMLESHKGSIMLETPLELSMKDIGNIIYHESTFTCCYGRLPLMITSGLRDTTGIYRNNRKSVIEVILADRLCYNVILDGRPLSLHGISTDARYDRPINRYYMFTTESGEELRDVLSDSPQYYNRKRFTRGHIDRGI